MRWQWLPCRWSIRPSEIAPPLPCRSRRQVSIGDGYGRNRCTERALEGGIGQTGSVTEEFQAVLRGHARCVGGFRPRCATGERARGHNSDGCSPQESFRWGRYRMLCVPPRLRQKPPQTSPEALSRLPVRRISVQPLRCSPHGCPGMRRWSLLNKRYPPEFFKNLLARLVTLSI